MRAIDPRKAVPAILLSACIACGGGGDSSTSLQGLLQESPWTTLGSRDAPSEQAEANLSNADARWVDYDTPERFPRTVTLANQYITMADGTRLAANVILPADENGRAVETPLPTVLVQTAYNKDFTDLSPALSGGGDYIVQRGYSQVVVDTRGTGRSEGQWESFGELEQSDYPAVVAWVREQPWSTGDIGVTGASLLGITSLLTAAQQPPGVKAVFAVVPMADAYRDIAFSGGQVNVGFLPFWLGLVTQFGVLHPSLADDTPQSLQTAFEHAVAAVTHFQVPQILRATAGDPAAIYDGEFWKIRSPLEKTPSIAVPTFIVGGARCLFQRGQPLLYEELKGHVPSKLLMLPGDHVQAASGEGLPTDGVPVLDHVLVQWFDEYVKGMDVGAAALPNVTQYVFGHGHYATATDWPHPLAHAERLHLRGNKRLTSERPAAGEASQNVIQQPANGICSQSTAQWTGGVLGVFGVNPPCFTDDSIVELLEVTYDTAPMEEDLYFNGPIQADVWLSSTSNDAPVVVRVADVSPSGTPFPLTHGIMQASLREVDESKSRFLDGEMIQPWHPFTQESVDPPGAGNVVLVPIEIFPTAALIKKGHRLRISVGASDFPHGLPPLPSAVNQLPGVLTIHSDAEHPSSIVLPVVSAGSLG